MSVGFVAPVPVRWSDIDMYQHVNHATMVTILEEARVPFLKEPFAADITTIGLLIADVRVTYKDQLRLTDSPLQVTMWTKRLRAVDFTLGLRGAFGQRRSGVQAGRHRRVAAGRGPYRGAAAGAALTTTSGVSATVGAIAERGLWLGPELGMPTARIWLRSSTMRCGSTTPRSFGSAPDPPDC